MEGPRALTTVIGAGAEIEEVYVAVDGDEVGREVFPVDVPTGEPPPGFDRVERAVLDSISDSETPQGLLALARPRLVDLDAIDPRSPVVVIDGVQDPGNVGAIVRVAAAMGVDVVVTTPGTADPLGPRAVRASAGTMALVGLCMRSRPEAVLETLLAGGRRVLVADTAGEDLSEVVVDQPWALVVGSEGHGVGEHFRGDDVTPVSIPMAAGVESLNVAVTAGIVLYSLRVGTAGPPDQCRCDDPAPPSDPSTVPRAVTSTVSVRRGDVRSS